MSTMEKKNPRHPHRPQGESGSPVLHDSAKTSPSRGWKGLRLSKEHWLGWLTLRHYLPRGLYARSFLILVIPLILFQAVLVAFFFDRHWGLVTERLARATAGDLRQIIDQIEEFETMRTLGTLDEKRVGASLRNMEQDYELWITWRPDVAFLTPDRAETRTWLVDRLMLMFNQELPWAFRINVDHFNRELVVDIQTARGLVTVVVPDRRIFSTTLYILGGWLTLSSIFLLLITWFFLRSQLRPVTFLARAAEVFGRGEMPEPIHAYGAKEIRHTTQAFNVMMQRISRHVRQRTDMLAGVSHDLRTPLSRIRLSVDLLDDSPERREIVQSVDEMTSMIRAYLDYAREGFAERAEQVNLSDVLGRCLDMARRDFPDVVWDGGPFEEIRLPLRAVSMRRAIGNLFENAAYVAQKVQVTLYRERDDVRISIEDEGPGIPEPLREQVFQPFFRLDRARNSGDGATGLGLAIARDVVRMHGGEILLTDSPLGGACFIVTLPLGPT